jgi:hypothetical protein
MKTPYPSETGCCSRFNPDPWDGREFQWSDKLFIKERVRCLWHIPLGFGRVVARVMEKISAANAFTPEPPMMLTDHTSKWGLDLYVEVPKEVSGTEMTRLSGRYVSKVFEGPYRDAGKWCGEMTEWMRSRGQQIQKLLMYYTTCPKCARHYGKNYVVILARA